MGIRDDEDAGGRIGPLSDMHKANQQRLREKYPDPPPTWRPLLGSVTPEDPKADQGVTNAPRVRRGITP